MCARIAAVIPTVTNPAAVIRDASNPVVVIPTATEEGMTVGPLATMTVTEGATTEEEGMTVGPLAMMTAAGEGEVEVEADPAGKHKAIFFNKSQKCVPIVTYSQQHI